MELEHSMAGGLALLPRPPRVMELPRGQWVPTVAAESTRLRATSSSMMLAAAVQEMLMVHRGSLSKKPPRGPSRRGEPGSGVVGICAVGSLLVVAEEESAAAARAVVKMAVLPGERTRQALAKRVARRMLRRGPSPSSPDHERRTVVLTCCCERLPSGLRCALLQHRGGGAPGLSWMHGGVAVAPRACGLGRWAFSEYARWLRSVWFEINQLSHLRNLHFSYPRFHPFLGKYCLSPWPVKKQTAALLTQVKKRMPDLSSHFSRLLQSCGETKNYSEFTDYLKGLSPSSLDMELRMLQLIDDDKFENLEPRPELQSISSLLDYFIHEFSCMNNFEFVQAVLKFFLKIHDETIRRHSMLQEKVKRHSMLQEKVKKLLNFQSVVWQKIDKMFQSA